MPCFFVHNARTKISGTNSFCKIIAKIVFRKKEHFLMIKLSKKLKKPPAHFGPTLSYYRKTKIFLKKSGPVTFTPLTSHSLKENYQKKIKQSILRQMCYVHINMHRQISRTLPVFLIAQKSS